jgi:hypothetical protein
MSIHGSTAEVGAEVAGLLDPTALLAVSCAEIVGIEMLLSGAAGRTSDVGGGKRQRVARRRPC